jgi:hypothetical protein
MVGEIFRSLQSRIVSMRVTARLEAVPYKD